MFAVAASATFYFFNTQTEQEEQTAEVTVATKIIEPGEMLALDVNIEVRAIPVSAVVEGAYGNTGPEALAAMEARARGRIPPGRQIVKADLLFPANSLREKIRQDVPVQGVEYPTHDEAGNPIEYPEFDHKFLSIPDTHRLVWINVAPENAVNNLLGSGDYVDVIAYAADVDVSRYVYEHIQILHKDGETYFFSMPKDHVLFFETLKRAPVALTLLSRPYDPSHTGIQPTVTEAQGVFSLFCPWDGFPRMLETPILPDQPTELEVPDDLPPACYAKIQAELLEIYAPVFGFASEYSALTERSLTPAYLPYDLDTPYSPSEGSLENWLGSGG